MEILMNVDVKNYELKVRKENEIWYLLGLRKSFTLTQDEIESIAKFVKIYSSDVDFQNEEKVLTEFINILNEMIQDRVFTTADFRKV